MAARVAFAGTATDSTTHTAADDNRNPGGWIGYVEVTADQTGIGTSDTDLTGLSVTVTANSSRRLKLTAQIYTQTPSSTPVSELKIKEGSTTLQLIQREQSAATGGPGGQTMIGQVVLTPSSGSHTYKLTLAATSSTVDMKASSTQPAFLLVEDIGPSA